MASAFPGMALGWSVVFSALAAQAAPPPELTVPQWADAHRQIAAESGARITGQWSTTTAPYMRRPMELCGVDHPAASVWVRWSAKTGKTQLFLNAAFHCIDTAPRSMMVVTPSKAKQNDFEREIWSPNAEATPRIALKIMATKSRSRQGSTADYKRFRGGFLRIINGGSEGQLQQSDIGLLIFEEPSSYPADVGGRGPPVRQARARSTAWGDDAKELGGGTPKIVGDCVVTDEVERRTCERFYVPCPHCGVRQVLLWENFTRSEGRPYFICGGEGASADEAAPRVGCGALIGHEHKLAMLAAADRGEGGWLASFRKLDDQGREDPENPAPPEAIDPADWPRWLDVRAPDTGSKLEGRDPSFDGIWQAYSPFATWASIWKAYDEAVASGDPEDLVTFFQQVLGRPFEAAYDKPKGNVLFEAREKAGRVAQLERGVIPPWAWAIFLAVDIQGDRLEWAVWAAGRGRREARIDSGVIPVPPVNPEAWAQLAEISRRTYEGPHIKPVPFDRIGIDTGGHHTSQAYVFCAGRPNTLALKGKPNDRDALPLTLGRRAKAKIGRRVVAETQLYLVGTHKLKKDVYHGLAQGLLSVEKGELLAGSTLLEPTATDLDFAQITAEVLLPPDRARGRKEETWDTQPKGARNEQLDMAVYAKALAWSFLPDNMTDADWDRLIAARRRDPTAPADLPLFAAIEAAPVDTPAASAPDDASGARTADHPLMRLAALNRRDA